MKDLQLDQASISEIVLECRENLDQTERAIITLEKAPDDRQAVDVIFRGFHSLKGICGLMGFERLESLFHQAESLLSQIREDNLVVNPVTITVLLKVIDDSRTILLNVEQMGEEGEDEDEVLVTELKLKTLQKQLDQTSSEQGKEPAATLPFSQAAEQFTYVGINEVNRLRILTEELSQISAHLKKIMAGVDSDHPVAEVSYRFSQATSQLNEVVTELREQTLERSFNAFPRLVRDLALSLGKRVQITVIGEKTRINTASLPALREALVHLVRNCVDHGIELPATRKSIGKPEVGVIRLRASDSPEAVVLEVEDDGHGIDSAAIRDKAARSGLVTQAELDKMDTFAIVQLIFLPGFSTAQEVTKLSGRGVGLDVVRTRLNQIGAGVEVFSSLNKGTLFRICIPKSNAISH